MAPLQLPGVAAARPKGHLHQVNHDKKESTNMTALTRSFANIGAVLGVVGAAISTAAALRINHRPSEADLARLGIDAHDFTVRL